MKYLVTGCAGFIGYHLCERLLTKDVRVVGIDNLNDYYDINLKNARLQNLTHAKNFTFHKLELSDRNSMSDLFKQEKFDIVINLAAQAGVRYSITDPYVYADSNLQGFLNVLEGCRHNAVQHLVYASSSSIYGLNTEYPFSETQQTDQPIALYAATKKANELMAHSYSYLYKFPCTGLRFFTVYGPWGRPDMALFKFTKNMMADKPIDVYNHGKMARDFTYIDDIINGVELATNRTNQHAELHRVYNLGRGKPVELMDFIKALEHTLGKKAKLNLMPMQPGDVPQTYADIGRLEQELGYKPTVDVEKGIAAFIAWYEKHYHTEKSGSA